MLSPVEELSGQLYKWEKRGRGWDVWPQPVELEPPLVPFRPQLPAAMRVRLDDSRVPGIFEHLLNPFRWFKAAGPVIGEAFEEDDPKPEPFEDDSPLLVLTLSIPPDTRVAPDVAEQLLTSLPAGTGPISFELIGRADSITAQFVAREDDAARIKQRVKGFFPEIIVTQTEDPLATHWQSCAHSFVVDAGLSREFMLPLRLVRAIDPDPLIAVAAALSQLEDEETAVLQVLFQSAVGAWGRHTMHAVLDPEGAPFFMDAPELVPLAKIKASRPIFAAVVRIGVKSSDCARAKEIAQSMFGALGSLADPLGNDLIPLSNADYDDQAHEEDVLLRRTRRSGMILNSHELLALVHPPSASVRTEKLVRSVRKTRAAPSIATAGKLTLGTNMHDGKSTPVTISADQRSRHTYVIGASGTGKSTLLLSMITQDMKNGEGLAVLDPHGDLIDQIITHVPDERLDDVVLIDPGDTEYPVGFNILNARTDLERSLLSSDLVAVFRRLSTSWGDQMTSVLGNAVLALLESERGGTLLDLRRFLVETKFRNEFLATVKDRDVVYYWQKEFPLLHGKPQAPILTRLDQFLRPKAIRYMVAQRDDKLDFAQMMNEGKIVLARLSHGAIGEENTYLLGTLLVSRFHQVALSRQEIAEEERRPFFLYIDEFQNFVTPTMAQILSGARKYRLGLILAHQELRQLTTRSPEVASSVLSNPANRICFRVGDQDARALEGGFVSFDARDLQTLEIGQAIVRVERADFDFNLDTQPLPSVERDEGRTKRESVISASRTRFALPRIAVEEILGAADPVVQPASVAESGHASVLSDPKREVRNTTAGSPAGVSFLTPRAASVEKRTPGRGGAQHKYLQELLKRWADARGWGALLEEPVLDGLGIVDVVLQKGERRIACEISVTTPVEHEIANLQKCLAAGFESVIIVSPEEKTVKAVERRARRGISEEVLRDVHFLTPEGTLQLLDGVDSSAIETTTSVRGFTVKVRQSSEGQSNAKRQAVSRVIARGLKRLQGKD